MTFLLLLLACGTSLEADCRASCDLYWRTCLGIANGGDMAAARSLQAASACSDSCAVNAEEEVRATEEWVECVADHEEDIAEYEADEESCFDLRTDCPAGDLFTPDLENL